MVRHQVRGGTRVPAQPSALPSGSRGPECILCDGARAERHTDREEILQTLAIRGRHVAAATQAVRDRIRGQGAEKVVRGDGDERERAQKRGPCTGAVQGTAGRWGARTATEPGDQTNGNQVGTRRWMVRFAGSAHRKRPGRGQMVGRKDKRHKGENVTVGGDVPHRGTGKMDGDPGNVPRKDAILRIHNRPNENDTSGGTTRRRHTGILKGAHAGDRHGG